MKKWFVLFGLVFSLVFIFNHVGARDDWPILKGPYLGQKPQGSMPEVFAPGVISTGHIEKCAVFTPDGKEFYFSVLGDSTCFTAVSKLEKENWSPPQITSFSRKYLNLHYSLSPDGERLYFSSENRPLGKLNDSQDKGNLWMVSRRNEGWSEPISLGAGVNANSSEFCPNVADNGNLYFYRRGHGKKSDWDIFVSFYKANKYGNAHKLGRAINSK